MTPIKVIPSVPGVLHLQFANRRELGLSMCRLAEFFESPHVQIRERLFTWEDFIEAYADAKGVIDYWSYWEGYNIPTPVIARFMREGFTLSRREARVLLDHNWADYNYLIATEPGSSAETVLHEEAHARWALQSSYRQRMAAIVDAIPNADQEMMGEDLLAGGYPPDAEILRDEIHAYCLTSDDRELTETFPSTPFETLLALRAKFREAEGRADA